MRKIISFMIILGLILSTLVAIPERAEAANDILLEYSCTRTDDYSLKVHVEILNWDLFSYSYISYGFSDSPESKPEYERFEYDHEFTDITSASYPMRVIVRIYQTEIPLDPIAETELTIDCSYYCDLQSPPTLCLNEDDSGQCCDGSCCSAGECCNGSCCETECCGDVCCDEGQVCCDGECCDDDCNDSDNDGICYDLDNCPGTPNPNQADTDGDGVGDACDGCPDDPDKTDPGQCGCGIADDDTDADGTADCNDGCPADPNKTEPGICGCGIPDDDTDADGIVDCIDNCPATPNPDQADSDGNGVGDACECPLDSFVTTHMEIGWKMTNDDTFSIAGKLQLPEDYAVEDLDTTATVSIAIADGLGTDTVEFTVLSWGKFSTLWKYSGDALPIGDGMNISQMQIWWAPSGWEQSGSGWFYIYGTLDLPDHIDKCTKPAKATIGMELTPTEGDCKTLVGEETIKPHRQVHHARGGNHRHGTHSNGRGLHDSRWYWSRSPWWW